MLLLIPADLSIFGLAMDNDHEHKAVLLLGSNQGDRLKSLQQAFHLIEEHAGEIRSSSSIYHTEPWGFESPSGFLNQALLIGTSLGPQEVLKVTQMIEKELGRDRLVDLYTSRTIDIDLILYDQLVINEADLTIPHPLMQLRKFVLIPVCEIVPGYIHPLSSKTVSQILEECEDELNVELFKPDEV